MSFRIPTARRLLILTACCLLPAACSSPAFAQSSRDKVQFRTVRVGFPPGPTTEDPNEINTIGPRDSLYKTAAWTPVYIGLTNINKYDPKRDGPAEVIVETPDCDDTAHTYTVIVPPFDEKEGLAGNADVVAYTRTGSRYGEIKIRVVAGGKDLCQPYETGRAVGGYQNAVALDPAQGLYLAVGSRLPGLRGLAKERTNQPAQPPDAGDQTERKFAVALLARVSELPTVWFGYAAADVVILSTSDRDFTTALVSDPGRLGALGEWVRRGGRLIVCAGRNADLLAGSAELNALLPVDVGPSYQAGSLQVVWRDGGAPGGDPLADPDPNKQLSLVRLTPRDKPPRPVRALVDGPKNVNQATPVVMQGPAGLGRVTVVAFDLDQSPFTRWTGHTEFWKQLLARAGPRIPASAVTNPNVYVYGQDRSSADRQLQGINNQLEQFEGVPVISFGWVALFILLYILVVGPLDYLFLKKVVKRLELTWVTFPTVVIAVSAAAYFTAYHLKGSELRINKFDLVDVDLQTNRAYGQTWFSLFSPRIQKYTVGVEPAAPWAGLPEGTEPATTVTWFGESRQGRQSLFRHSYEYAPRAEGLRGVPIQVWTTKGFQADWAAPLVKDAPAIESRLRHPPGRPDDLIGSVTSRLPVPLEEVILIYRGEAAVLGTLLPDTQKTVTAQARVKFSTLRDNPAGAQGGDATATSTIANDLRLELLFHEAWNGQQDPTNGSLRDLDQSWRVTDDNRDEVILVGRLKQEKGPAEAVTAGAGSPGRLWLDKLPTDGGNRPTLNGTLRQDTIVRVFIPLAAER
jgi:hypothetical protein